MQDNKYWDSRAEKYGHTGWGNPVIYEFDQKVRLKVIEYIYNSIQTPIENVLDFGGGDGDFSLFFSKFCSKVVCYDISEGVLEIAKRRSMENGVQNICFSSDEKEVLNEDTKYDLILCITVLQHIKNNDDLMELLNNLKKRLSKTGKILILENTFTNEKVDNEYIKYRTISEFEKMIKESELKIKRCYGFYHPILKPTESYKKYYKNIGIRIINQIADKGFYRLAVFLLKRFCIENRYIGSGEDYLFEEQETDSSRIYILER